MVRITLEKEDIMKLIEDKYPGAELVDKKTLDDFEISIRISEYKVEQKRAPPPPPPEKKMVRNTDGSIDAKASGLSLESRKRTIPGGAMGRERGRMKTF